MQFNFLDATDSHRKKMKGEIIHSGHFMVSDFEAEGRDEDDEVLITVPEKSTDSASLSGGGVAAQGVGPAGDLSSVDSPGATAVPAAVVRTQNLSDATSLECNYRGLLPTADKIPSHYLLLRHLKNRSRTIGKHAGQEPDGFDGTERAPVDERRTEQRSCCRHRPESYQTLSMHVSGLQVKTNH